MSRERALDPRYVEEKYGVDVNLMESLENYLQSTGDLTAISHASVHELVDADPNICEMSLRWTLSKTDQRVGAMGTLWQSKGITISSRSYTDGEHDVGIYFTGDIKDLALKPKDLTSKEIPRSIGIGWVEISESPLFNYFYSGLQIQRKMMEQEFGSQTADMSIEEKIWMAMILAKPRPDYRYGIGNATGIESKVQNKFLNIAV